MSLKGIPRSHCHFIKELDSLDGLHTTEYGGYNTFNLHVQDSKDWRTHECSTIIFCNWCIRLENMVYLSLIHIHLFTFFSAEQESVAAANFHSRRVPRWARRHTLALWRQPGETQPCESLRPPSAKPLCDVREGTACVLDAVWWTVWAEDGLHPTRVQTGRSSPVLVSDSDQQDEVMRFVGLPVHCHVHQQNQANINAVTSLSFAV